MKKSDMLAHLASLLCGVVLFGLLLLPVFGFMTYHVVETYSFDATITDKAVVGGGYQPRCYALFFVDGDEAGEVWVTSADYARYDVGDLVRVEAETRENFFGEVETNYKFGVDN